MVRAQGKRPQKEAWASGGGGALGRWARLCLASRLLLPSLSPPVSDLPLPSSYKDTCHRLGATQVTGDDLVKRAIPR